MKISPRALCFVFLFASLAAAPLAYVADRMHVSAAFATLTLGAGAAAVLWLCALIAVGAVRQLSFGVGALLGLLSFAVAVFFSQLVGQHSASWRVTSAAWVLVWVSFYPALVGGSLGYFFRRLPLKNAL